MFLLGDTSSQYTLSVWVHGATSSTGRIQLAVFTSKEDFLKKPVQTASRPVNEEGAVLFEFHLPEGSYALAAFHDVNLNDKLDKSFLGIPKEPYAFSNQAKGLFGPPAFKDTLFELKQDQTLKIRLSSAEQ